MCTFTGSDYLQYKVIKGSDYLQCKMNIQQYQEAIYWVYDKLEATIANPIPSIRWTTEDPVVLQQNWPIGVEEIPVGELSNSLECLVKVLNLILNKAPVLTRVF